MSVPEQQLERLDGLPPYAGLVAMRGPYRW